MSDITRKDFLKLTQNIFTFIGLGVVITPIVAYFYPSELEEMPTEPVIVGKLDELPPGKSTTIQFGRYPAIVIHTEDGIKAYSAVCTHFACITKWNEGLGQIVCPCHEGYFDPLDGRVLAGPPPSPLEALDVLITEDTIYIQVGGEA
ncbi:Rieske (2Fe-2S) protein [bacterium]|nr:Rieske (2Fe-2S) protein [bacterium]